MTVKLERVSQKSELPPTILHEVKGELLKEMPLIVKLGSLEQADMTRELLQTTFALSAPTPQEIKLIGEFVATHTMAGLEARERQTRFLHVLPALVPYLDAGFVIATVEAYHSPPSAYEWLRDVVPVLAVTDHRDALMTLSSLLPTQQHEWSVREHDAIILFEAMANKTDDEAMTIFQRNFDALNQGIQKPDFFQKENYEKHLLCMLRIKSAIVRALTHSRHQQALPLLQNELIKVIHISKNNDRLRYNENADHMDAHIQEITQAIVAGGVTREVFQFFAGIMEKGNARTVTSIVRAILPDGWENLGQTLYEHLSEYRTEDKELLIRILGLAHGYGTSDDIHEIREWLQFNEKSTWTSWPSNDRYIQHQTLVSFAQETLSAFETQEPFVFTPHTPELTSLQRHVRGSLIPDLPRRQNPEHSWEKHMPFPILFQIIFSESKSKLREPALIALYQKIPLMDQNQRTSLAYALLERLGKHLTPEETMHAVHIATTIEPQQLRFVVAYNLNDLFALRGALWTLENAAQLEYNT